MEKILVIANPGSGKGLAEVHALSLKDLLEENYQAKVEIRLTQTLNDAKIWAQHSLQDNFDTVICLGGDGTVNEVISGLMTLEELERPKFSFIPLGTVNDLARALEYPLIANQTIECFRNLEEMQVDVAKVNDHYFINVLALGSIPTAVLQTESQQKNRFGILAYIMNGFKAFFEGYPQALRITDENQTSYDLETNLLLIALTSSVGGVENLLPEAKFDDGQAFLIALKNSMAISSIQTLIQDQGLPTSYTNNDYILVLRGKQFTVEAINVKSKDELVANIDGDQGPSLPLKVEIIQKAISMLVPKES
ncbi:diacylglycerol kinase family lipid kinase [Facklamia sp. DSM 111018]|uniref:Diacylglycerol kinase family lipid kinase n=1 Tax=Facklamia lactis TaxID=2749967 RepID=A0ABS0LRQ8_9LACT|nr:diacylglycerol kinase family protein [Facklamia lactis]MBG9980152.1 diacylglycerol kinase family lipid kinase [Facklamia lactis]MBG9985954.1 diacylglycerol kinase family lipid kinase [Facklamia lactis]